MNMEEILNSPELSQELDKAYAIAAPYLARVRFRLAIINACVTYHYLGTQVQSLVRNNNFYNGYTTTMIDAGSGFIHEDLRA